MNELDRPKYVGASVKRVEDPRLLTGQGAFADDLSRPGMLHLVLVRSAHALAQIRAIDTSAARAMPGVHAVLVASDVVTAQPLYAPSKITAYKAANIPLLATDRVHYVGEPVAAVLADSRYRAEDAARRVVVDYDPLPTTADPEAAIAAGAPLVHPELGTNLGFDREFVRGDVKAAFASAAVRVSARIRGHRIAPLAMENRSYLAEYSSARRELTLHGATQVPGIVRDAVCDLLDLPGSSVRVIAGDVGGGFGSKTAVYTEEVLVCVLARRFGRPVKYTGDRLDDLSSTTQAFDEIIDAELAVDAEGRLLALSAQVLGDIGAYSIYPWTAAAEPVQVVGFLPGPYQLANYYARVRGAITPKVPLGAYRGVGRPPAVFAMERLVDMAARKLRMDPAEIRRRNLIRPDQFPYKAGSGIIWDHAAFLECLELACTHVDYPKLREMQAEARAAGRLVGIGFASYAELSGVGSKIPAAPGMPVNTGTETATVRVDATGAVTAIFGVTSIGQGVETALSQIVADEIGARIDDVRVQIGSTDGRAYTTGTYASRATVIAGGAGKLAAQAVRELLVNAGAHLMEAAPGDLDVAQGQVFVRGTDRRMTFREIARRIYIDFGRMPKDLQRDLEATRLYDPVVGTTSSASHIAVVEVDPVTFQVKVLRYVVSEDCGRIVNPMIVDGQVHGGVAQGIGAALFEEIVYDADGQLLTGSLMDYLAVSATEVPDIDSLHVESESPTTLGGFRGMGEGGTIGAPAAIANAVSDAIGIEVTEIPMTPERLFRLMRNR